MRDLITIDNICKSLHKYQGRIELINKINNIHFLLLKYYLQVEDKEAFTIDEDEIKKLKEIGLFLFDLATDEMFEKAIDSQTKRDLFDISLNLFEQLCKIYKLRFEEFKNGYLELLLIAISCAALGDNPSKAYVIFRKYHLNIEDLYGEEIYFYAILAFLSKNYGVLSIDEKEIARRMIVNTKNIKYHILNNIIKEIYRTIIYLNTGEEKIIEDIKLNLEKTYELALTNNYYREIWIIKKIQECIHMTINKSLWYVLGEHLREDSIKSLIGSKRKPTYELWSHQIEIINNNLLDINTNNIVNIPTSSGKSLIAQICILKVLQEYKDNTCIYVVPTNALLSQVKQDLSSMFKRLNIDVDALVSGYDVLSPDIEKNKIEDSKVLIITQEKLDSLIRKEDDYIKRCKLFVFDEFHNISSGSRGLLLEFVVAKIKLMNLGNEPKMLFLSAVLPNVLKFKEWIGTDITREYSNTDCRPTKQIKIIGHYLNNYESPKRGHYDELIESGIRIFYPNNRHGNIKFPSITRHVTCKSKLYKNLNFCADLAEKFSNIGNVLVYIPNTSWFKSFCLNMFERKILLSGYEKEKLNDIANYVALTIGYDHYLVESIRLGFAFHHKRLPNNVKRIIEIAFKDGIIKVLAATSTLAQGLNFPISAIILGSLYAGSNEMNLEEIENLVGRAGRAMRETEGYVVLPIKLNPVYDVKSHEKRIFRMRDNYLYKDLSSIIIDSSVKKLLEVLEKEESELDESEKEIIRIYNSVIFDLTENNLLQTDEDYLKIIESLFYSVDARHEEKEKLIFHTKEMVVNIRNKIDLVDNITIKKILKNSGLSIDTAIGIYYAVINNLDEELDYVFENRKLNPKFIQLINEIIELPEFKTNYNGEFIYNCLNSWIFMDNYATICNKFFNGNFDKCVDFIDQEIIYKGAWYFSLVYQLYDALFVENLETITKWNSFRIFDDFCNIPAYCKFGVEDKGMVEIMESGLYERELLIKAVKTFSLHSKMDIVIPEYFYEWTKYANLVNIENLGILISSHELEQWKIFKNLFLQDVNEYTQILSISIKGYGLYETIKLIEGDPLLIKHERDNLHDEFAIGIFTLEDKKIGYIDREYSKYIYEILEAKGNVVWVFIENEYGSSMSCKVIIV
ncbi:DEAD/DEAH box helicase [uncultured Tissierella sp.]|uniref:DEAD/DEAH box helicase n=1 Tax=uncultured Tissierella sp. TaxID=448160 RepID=UPI002803D137|nr:DEAD/DEAH box helicase [uncultured Tissierella sp.]MDU5081862.1 DEAD/DEAH box helicase [Bacillota bacterium]